MRFLFLLILFTGCEVRPVKCKVTPESYSQHIACHCVYKCEVTATEVIVTSDGFCNPLCEEIDE